jgi:hypothetical protein
MHRFDVRSPEQQAESAANEHYRELQAEVIATVSSKLSARKMSLDESDLDKGRGVAVDGHLDWREWETQEGQKREAIDIVADQVQFLNERGEVETPEDYDDAEFQPVPVAAGGEGLTGADDDIPF